MSVHARGGCSRCRNWPGWETERMLRRYAHLSRERLAPHAERPAEHLGMFWVQPVDDDNQKPRKKPATCHCFQQKSGDLPRRELRRTW